MWFRYEFSHSSKSLPFSATLSTAQRSLMAMVFKRAIFRKGSSSLGLRILWRWASGTWHNQTVVRNLWAMGLRHPNAIGFSLFRQFAEMRTTPMKDCSKNNFTRLQSGWFWTKVMLFKSLNFPKRRISLVRTSIRTKWKWMLVTALWYSSELANNNCNHTISYDIIRHTHEAKDMRRFISADPGLRQGRGGAWDHRRCGTSPS